MFSMWRFGLTAVTSLLTMISWLLGGSHAAHTSHSAHSSPTPAAGRHATSSRPAHPGASPSAANGVRIAGTISAARAGTPAHALVLGVYAGPASKGVAGAQTFAAFSGSAPGAVLDFAATSNWYGITGPNWLLDPRVGSSARLEYSLPMFPDGTGYSLAACASGAYNAEWRQTAQSLVAHRLADTIVRPGWEFNGNWYHWSAKKDIAGFVGCFRQIVTTMRAVPGQHLAFDWNPNVGANAFPAEQAYPGDGYVDYIGVDIYDTSWSHYPSSDMSAARAAAWNDDLNGNHGLAFWSRFATTHHKPMAITEWGVAALSNGHGGGDDPAFIDHMFDFMTNPANNVAYMHYFDWTSASADHKLTGATQFPASAAEYHKRSEAVTSGKTPAR